MGFPARRRTGALARIHDAHPGEGCRLSDHRRRDREIRSVTERQKLKLSWRPDDWPHDTTLQVTVKEVADGTTIGFRHEQLADRDERHMMVGHWKNVVAELAKAIEG